MNVLTTSLEGVLIIEPDVFNDNRGFFMETFNTKRYSKDGIKAEFVQDNLSCSGKGTLRGLHYQFPNEQAKLVQVIQGEVFDVTVDIRQGSPTFGKWISVLLSEENKKQLFIPEGFAHGFYVLSDTAIFVYKCSNLFSPADEGGILWNDPDLEINWPADSPLLSEKDSKYPYLTNVPSKHLPIYGGMA